MAVNTDVVGKSYPPALYAVGREKVREYARAVGETDPLHHDVDAAREAGHADVVAPPMFAVVYAMPAVAQGMFDPAVGIDFSRLVHAGQELVWGPVVVAGDEISTTVTRRGRLRAARQRLLRLRVRVAQPARRARVHGDVVEHRARSVSMKPGDEIRRCP